MEVVAVEATLWAHIRRTRHRAAEHCGRRVSISRALVVQPATTCPAYTSAYVGSSVQRPAVGGGGGGGLVTAGLEIVGVDSTVVDTPFAARAD